MQMPVPDMTVLEGREAIVKDLRALLGDGVIDDPAALAAYSCDGLTAYRELPVAAVLPRTTQEVSRILAYCHERGVKVVARGSGTSLSGGALPLADGILMGMARFNRILVVDYEDRVAVVQPGVTNLAISQAVAGRGFYYAPDPSSQIACSIGGNVAENAGGVHCLKYGMTSNNVLGAEMVLMDGTVVRLGGRGMDAAGYDLLGVVCGSEGMLGVVTEVTVRIQPKPPFQRAMLLGFPTVEAAGECVAAIIGGGGIIPAALEIMDRAATHAAEDFLHAGYPLDVDAMMIVEVDGTVAEVDHLIAEVERIARARAPPMPGPRSTRRSALVLGGAQGGLPGGGPYLARQLLRGRHDPAPQAGRGADPHRRDRARVTACAWSTSSMPATAISTR